MPLSQDSLSAGKYYYRKHRSQWGVWKEGKPGNNGVQMDEFIMDFSTKIQAKNFVYKMNNWTLKKDNEDGTE